MSNDLLNDSGSLPRLIHEPCPFSESVRFKECPEDFIVEELPLYEPGGDGTHVYLWIEKKRITSHEAARRLAHALGKKPRDAGMAGLKDAQAITRQWVSFEHVKEDLLTSLEGSDELQVLQVNRHGNKLKMGHLRGNRFLVRLRTEHANEVGAHAESALQTLHEQGIPNYYGVQRFGRYGKNADLGRFLVLGDEAGFQGLAAEAGLRGAKAKDRKLRNLLVNAFQAKLFNQVLAERMPGIGEVWAGELAFLHRNGAVFDVEDLEQDSQRCAQFEISPSGPMFGPKMRQPSGRAGELEEKVLTASGVTLEAFGSKLAQRQKGARRPLRIPFLERPEMKVEEGAVQLSFALPSGAYATVVLREILGQDV